MAKNTGKELEKMVGRIYELLTFDNRHVSVEVDVFIDSPDGPRQFDVVVRSLVNGIEVLTVIEVRDWKNRLSISHVDGFVSKMEDVGAQKAILVSRYGFQKSAIRKAKRKGIDICTAHHLENLKDFRGQAPVVVHNLKFGHIRIRCGIQEEVSKSGKVDFMKVMADGVPVLDTFRSGIANGKILPNIRGKLKKSELEKMNGIEVGGEILNLDDLDGPNNKWSPTGELKLTYFDQRSGKLFEVSHFEINYSMLYQYYFGYLTDLPGSFALDNISVSVGTIFFDPEMISDFENRFIEFEALDEIPVKEAVNMHFLEHVNYELIHGAMK